MRRDSKESRFPHIPTRFRQNSSANPRRQSVRIAQPAVTVDCHPAGTVLPNALPELLLIVISKLTPWICQGLQNKHKKIKMLETVPRVSLNDGFPLVSSMISIYISILGTSSNISKHRLEPGHCSRSKCGEFTWKTRAYPEFQP